MLQRLCLLALLLVVPTAFHGLLRGASQSPLTGGSPPQRVQLTADDTQRLAREARAQANVEVPEGLELTLWAPTELIIDPVAIDLDARGVLYATSTTRNNLPLDIRGHRDWMTVAHTLKSLQDLRAFYEREMAPSRSEQNTWIDDLNGDGSRDIHDLKEMKERIYRLTDTNGDGMADLSEVVMEGFNDDPTWDIAGGIMYHEGDLIVGVPPGVYRLRDADGDGRFEQQTTISEGFSTHPTFGGHGVSGVMMGPDGRLYWEVGDMGMNVTDDKGKQWAYPNQGVVARSELDGSGFEVFATGIRNLQEFSFDDRGNLISVDNDGDHPGESERLVYIPYGADSGWRSNWQYGKYTDDRNNRYNVWMAEQMFKPRHDGQAAHILPPIANWHAGPSGMAYNPGTALSDAWRNHFFVTSFPGAPANARIYAFTLKEDGATFAMDSEKVLLRGILSVGLRIGPDGALYLTDWITGWDSKDNGRLWKLDAPAEAGSAMRREVQSLLIENFASRQVADVAALLGHADMRVRQKAQFDLARRGDVQTLLTAARSATTMHARLHGMWGVAQLARKDPAHAAHLRPFLKDPDGEIRAQAARLIGDVRLAAAGAELLPLLMDTAPRARFFAAEALGRIAYAGAVEPLIDMLADNDGHDTAIHHAGSLALASIGNGAALERLSTHQSRAVRVAAIVALRRMQDAGVARFLSDADEHVVTEAARAINDDGSIRAAVPQLAALLGSTRFANEPLLRRAINANLRLGTDAAVQRLAAFAATSAPEDLRIEAIAALGVWSAPSPLDRVDGYYLEPFDVQDTVPAGRTAQGDRTRGSDAASAALQRLFDSMTAAGAPPASADVKVAMAQAASRLGVRSAEPVLRGQLRADPDPAVRIAALEALQTLKVPGIEDLMQTAFADKDASVRRAALGLLPDLPLSSAAKASYAASVFERGSVTEQQGALEVLGRLNSGDSRKQLGAYIDELSAGRMKPELQVDLLDAAQRDGAPELRQQLDAFQQARKADSLAQAFSEGLMRGGDARRGRQVFTRNPLAECSRCHAIGGQGSDVGPDLTRIGSVLTREQLLESLIAPSARIAPGYGLVALTLRDGTRVEGILREENDAQVTLVVGTPGVEQRVAKADISERTDPISAMPPLGLLLEPREVRDLVEFLAALK